MVNISTLILRDIYFDDYISKHKNYFSQIGSIHKHLQSPGYKVSTFWTGWQKGSVSVRVQQHQNFIERFTKIQLLRHGFKHHVTCTWMNSVY